jgi:hypothetical protein
MKPKVRPRNIKRVVKALAESGYDTIGKLAALMRDKADWWHKEVNGIGKDSKGPIEDAVAEVMAQTAAKAS